MPMSRAILMNHIMDICAKYDRRKGKRATYREFKKVCAVDSLSRMMLLEINGWRRGNTFVPKHQRMEGLKFYYGPKNAAEEERFHPILSDIASFIASAQIHEEELQEKRK